MVLFMASLNQQQQTSLLLHNFVNNCLKLLIIIVMVTFPFCFAWQSQTLTSALPLEILHSSTVLQFLGSSNSIRDWLKITVSWLSNQWGNSKANYSLPPTLLASSFIYPIVSKHAWCWRSPTSSPVITEHTGQWCAHSAPSYNVFPFFLF